jgi:hypothetical protein
MVSFSLGLPTVISLNLVVRMLVLNDVEMNGYLDKNAYQLGIHENALGLRMKIVHIIYVNLLILPFLVCNMLC